MTSEDHTLLKSKFFNEADILFWLWDKDLNLVDVNEATLKTFNFKRADIIGKNICEISPDAKPSGRFDQYMEVIRTGETLLIDEVKAHPSLGNFYFRLKAFKVGDGLGSVLSNITDLKKTIEELETFIYKSTHDMRSPVASILGLLNLVNSEVKDIDDAKRFLNIVKQQSHRLDSILQKLIETTRVRKGEKTIHLIDFEVLLEEVLNSLRYMEGFNSIRFDKSINVKQLFYSDKSLIVSILQNLIDNAVKYKNVNIGDSFINISITSEKDGVKIICADNGIGIPEELQNDVFKMFFRATNASSGSGLGLYTVNQTIKKLNGQMQLESKEKIGTTFRVYIPDEKV